MPAVSKAQQRFFGAALARARAGKRRKGDPSAKVAREFAKTKLKGLPEHVRKVKSS
jgi:hypothetical protein